jgi:hypothetical protein
VVSAGSVSAAVETARSSCRIGEIATYPADVHQERLSWIHAEPTARFTAEADGVGTRPVTACGTKGVDTDRRNTSRDSERVLARR